MKPEMKQENKILFANNERVIFERSPEGILTINLSSYPHIIRALGHDFLKEPLLYLNALSDVARHTDMEFLYELLESGAKQARH